MLCGLDDGRIVIFTLGDFSIPAYQRQRCFERFPSRIERGHVGRFKRRGGADTDALSLPPSSIFLVVL